MNACTGTPYGQDQLQTDSFTTCLQNCIEDTQCVSFTHQPERNKETLQHTQGKCFYFDHLCGGGPYLPLDPSTFSCSQEACSIDSFNVSEGKYYNLKNLSFNSLNHPAKYEFF